MRFQETILERLGKALHARMDDITHEAVPRRWVELILFLEEKERTLPERHDKPGIPALVPNDCEPELCWNRISTGQIARNGTNDLMRGSPCICPRGECAPCGTPCGMSCARWFGWRR